jgi:hypothetical protein
MRAGCNREVERTLFEGNVDLHENVDLKMKELTRAFDSPDGILRLCHDLRGR